MLLAFTFATFSFLLDLALLFLGARLLLVRLTLHSELTTVLHLLQTCSLLLLLPLLLYQAESAPHIEVNNWDDEPS